MFNTFLRVEIKILLSLVFVIQIHDVKEENLSTRLSCIRICSSIERYRRKRVYASSYFDNSKNVVISLIRRVDSIINNRSYNNNK